MEIEVIQSDKTVLRIAISGKLDANSIGSHAWEFQDLVQHSKAPSVFLDFAGVTFLSSLGIMMLLSAAKELRKANRTLRIEKPLPEVINVIHIAGLDELII